MVQRSLATKKRCDRMVMQTYKALLDRFEELGKKAEDNFDNIVKTECEMVV